jgi:hypothetical protein
VHPIVYRIDGEPCSDLLAIPPDLSYGEVGATTHLVDQLLQTVRKDGDKAADTWRRSSASNQDCGMLMRAATLGFPGAVITRSSDTLVVEFDDAKCISELTAGLSAATRSTCEKDNQTGVAAPIRLRYSFKTRMMSLTARPIAGEALGGGSYRTIKKPRIQKDKIPVLATVPALKPASRKRIVTALVIKLK